MGHITPRTAMVRKFVASLILFIAFANISFAARVSCDVGDRARSSVGLSGGSTDLSPSGGTYVTLKHLQHGSSNNTHHRSQDQIHHCHFGYCSVILTYIIQSPHISCTELGVHQQDPNLIACVTSHFRPPIS